MHSGEVVMGAPEGSCRQIASKNPMTAATAGACVALKSLLAVDCRLLNVYWGSGSVKGTGGSLWMAGSRPPLPSPSPPAITKAGGSTGSNSRTVSRYTVITWTRR